MHSRKGSAESDLTTRARIRDAAVASFGRHGFDVSVRTIAEGASVSPGLVIHHFGSKADLRRACDEHVAGRIAELTEEDMGDGAQTFLHQLASVERYAVLTGYVVRTLCDGGPLAVELYARMVDDAVGYFARGETAGGIRPSRDPAGRAHWAVTSAVGSLLLLVALRHPGPDVDYARVIEDWAAEFTLPTLEMYTESVFTDRAILDGYLRHLGGGAEDPEST
ncbi:TetR/AcrR family transcriptional regulator [Actinoalloteichus sp. GBA129-24]|uniref:TetR/AcrR family transcriptional regulator n=1 Tax=Actinoalloteichus sp. GBA129-24 TaxID=1612551 RepID=UPI0009F86378|nr:TetR family transcriptional regulator [Actinoalloteichus sp. GBA129-24]